jgi:hypothetical protein
LYVGLRSEITVSAMSKVYPRFHDGLWCA